MSPRAARRIGWGLALVGLLGGVDLFLGKRTYGDTLRVLSVGGLRSRGDRTEFLVGFERPGRFRSVSGLWCWEITQPGATTFPAPAIDVFAPGGRMSVAEAAAQQLPAGMRPASWLDAVQAELEGGAPAAEGFSPRVRPEVLRLVR